MPESLTKRFAGMPRWAWLAIIAGGVTIGLILRSRMTGEEGESAEDEELTEFEETDALLDDGVYDDSGEYGYGYPYGGGGGFGGSFGGGGGGIPAEPVDIPDIGGEQSGGGVTTADINIHFLPSGEPSPSDSPVTTPPKPGPGYHWNPGKGWVYKDPSKWKWDKEKKRFIKRPDVQSGSRQGGRQNGGGNKPPGTQSARGTGGGAPKRPANKAMNPPPKKPSPIAVKPGGKTGAKVKAKKK